MKPNKSDYIDAEAIGEAVQRPSMRFVPLKKEEQLDLQAVHRVRERWVMRRRAVINQIRGLLLERGITLPEAQSHLEEGLPEILAEALTRFSESIFVLAGATADRTRSPENSHRGNGCAHFADFERARCLPETDHHTRSRAGHRDRIRGCDR